MWINHDLVALGLQYVYLRDGDYLRIALPPGGDRVDHVATRCLATALHQGMGIDEVLDRHAMFTLGWYDEVVPHPLVPLHHEEHEQDHMNLNYPASGAFSAIMLERIYMVNLWSPVGR